MIVLHTCDTHTQILVFWGLVDVAVYMLHIDNYCLIFGNVILQISERVVRGCKELVRKMNVNSVIK